MALNAENSPSISELRENIHYAKASAGLLSFATFLGITDLHFENILIQKNTQGELEPVPIDLEVAFWDSISAIDSNLIPSSFTPPEKAGLNAGSHEFYWPSDFPIFLDAFLKQSQNLIPAVGDLLSAMELTLRGHPIRIFLRSTKDYRLFRSHLLENKALNELELERKGYDLLPEEVLQLKAGDIPYFFTFRDDNPRMYYFSAPEKISVAEPRHLHTFFEMAVHPISFLADIKRLNRLLMISALHIYKAYSSFIDQKRGNKGEYFEIKRDGDLFEMRTPWFEAKASTS